MAGFTAPKKKTADEKLAKSNPINTDVISKIKKEAEKQEEQKSSAQPKEVQQKEEQKSPKTESKPKKAKSEGSKSRKVHAAVYLDETDLRFLGLVAKLEGSSTSSYISNILSKELEKKKKELPDLYKISSNS